ncbi:MAG: hypothetical protein PHR53_01275 [Bacteroidales bacterium]|nr:hypothetical protein [Bacteroidales bacterium]
MKIRELIEVLHCEVVCGTDFLDTEINFGFASDLMSDVLTLQQSNLLLLTGLSNLQSIRTAEMADIKCIMLVRDKHPSEEMIELANDNDIVILRYSSSMFKACGILYNAGLKPVY